MAAAFSGIVAHSTSRDAGLLYFLLFGPLIVILSVVALAWFFRAPPRRLEKLACTVMSALLLVALTLFLPPANGFPAPLHQTV
jgi:hypothetical protein